MATELVQHDDGILGDTGQLFIEFAEENIVQASVVLAERAVLLLGQTGKADRSKDKRGEKQNKEEALIKLELVETQALIFYADAKNSAPIMEEINQL